jgi:hypothetical protein
MMFIFKKILQLERNVMPIEELDVLVLESLPLVMSFLVSNILLNGIPQ